MEKVHFAGLVEDLPQFYTDIDMALLTSDNEGTPVTLLEAQAAGKWVVAPNVGGIADVLNSQAGSLVMPNQVSAYVAALSSVIETGSQRAASSLTAREKIVQRFNSSNLSDNIDHLYRILLNKTT